MIVCSCNVFSDRDVRTALDSAPARPATANQVYGCLGCSPQCGRCARTIRRIMDECLGACCNAPMAQINDDYYEDLTSENFMRLLDDLAAGRPVKAGSQIGRVSSEPVGGLTSLTTLYGADGRGGKAGAPVNDEQGAAAQSRAKPGR